MRAILAALALLPGLASAAPPTPAEAPDRTVEIVTFALSGAATVAGLAVWVDSANQIADEVPQGFGYERAERVSILWGRQQVAMGATLTGAVLTGLTAYLAFRPATAESLTPSASITPEGGVFGLSGRF